LQLNRNRKRKMLQLNKRRKRKKLLSVKGLLKRNVSSKKRKRRNAKN